MDIVPNIPVTPVNDRITDMLALHLAGFKQLPPVIVIIVQYDLFVFISGKRLIDASSLFSFLALCPSYAGSDKPPNTAPFL